MVLVLSLVLAWLTQAAVHDQSIAEYLNEEWPAPAMWSGYLAQLGYTRVSQPAVQTRLLQYYAPSMQSTAVVMISSPPGLVYISERPGSQQPELWVSTPQPQPPRQWLRLGSGWNAFQNLPKPPQTAPKPSKKLSNPIDPKEIRY